jgi:hypothetical protein
MSNSAPQLIEDFNKSLKGGKKRHGNSSLKAWVKFVKKVAKEEKLPYGAAMKRAKVRKDKGEKWMMGGEGTGNTIPIEAPTSQAASLRSQAAVARSQGNETEATRLEADATRREDEDATGNASSSDIVTVGGRRRKGKSHKKHGGSKKRRGRRGTKKRRY